MVTNVAMLGRWSKYGNWFQAPQYGNSNGYGTLQAVSWNMAETLTLEAVFWQMLDEVIVTTVLDPEMYTPPPWKQHRGL